MVINYYAYAILGDTQNGMETGAIIQRNGTQELRTQSDLQDLMKTEYSGWTLMTTLISLNVLMLVSCYLKNKDGIH